MSQLEMLTLSLVVRCRISFIDGTHLINNIINKMPYMQTFTFNIVTELVTMDEEFLPTSDNVKCALIQKGYNVGCYTDYSRFHQGQCHIYSLPYTMNRMDIYSSKFPGGLFPTVRHICVRNFGRSFEYDFFARISQAFPLLNKLEIFNTNEQKKKLTHTQNEYEQTSALIVFSHLKILSFLISHIDYVKQFLFDFNTRLPCLNTLHVEYEDLMIVTENCTNNAARANCSKLQHIISDLKPITYPPNFYLYFPLLK